MAESWNFCEGCREIQKKLNDLSDRDSEQAEINALQTQLEELIASMTGGEY
jgi:hypothetical protein